MKIIRLCVVAAALVCCQPGFAQLPLGRIERSDPAVVNSFATQVALALQSDGSYVAIAGAPRDDDVITDGGAWYTFTRGPGNADPWVQVSKTVAPLPTEFGGAGSKVAAVDGYIFVTSLRETTPGQAQGRLYVCARDQGGLDNWGISQVISPIRTNTAFGFAQSIYAHGSLLFISDTAADSGGVTAAGNVLVYRRDGAGQYQLVRTIDAPVPGNTNQFGFKVASNGDTLVVGENRFTVFFPGTILFQGRAYIFERDLGGADNWGLAATLDPSPALERTFYGSLVGAGGSQGNPVVFVGSTSVGYIDVYDKPGGVWQKRSQFTSPDGPAEIGFGRPVADVSPLTGTARVLIGQSAKAIGESGAVFHFLDDVLTPGTLAQVGVARDPTPPGADGFSSFGGVLALAGDLMIVGESTTEDGRVGSLWLYRLFDPPPVFADCNGNDIPDLNEIILGLATDCNDNAIPDDCDIASGVLTDANGDGIPDECQDDCPVDFNGDGVLDFFDVSVFLQLFSSGCP